MSRRAQLLFITIILLLLGIPAVYVAYSWSAEDPFQFRYLGKGPAREIVPSMLSRDEPQLMVPLSIEVRNIRPVPIYLREVILTALMRPHADSDPDAQVAASVQPIVLPAEVPTRLVLSAYVAATSASPGAGSAAVPGLRIPAHGTERIELLVNAEDATLFQSDSLEANSTSMTVTRGHVKRLRDWAHMKLWPWFEDHKSIPLPSIRAEVQHASVEDASTP